MNRVDDQLLMAYVDGELDEDSRLEVDALLAEAPELNRRLRALIESNGLLNSAFIDRLQGSMPPLRAFANENGLRGFDRIMSRLGFGAGLSWQPLVFCSLLFLVLGGLGGYQFTRDQVRTGGEGLALRQPEDSAIFKTSLNQVLETQVSGMVIDWYNPDTGRGGKIMPTRTFKVDNGQYCREFQDTRRLYDETVQENGIACRVGQGEWRIRAKYFL